MLQKRLFRGLAVGILAAAWVSPARAASPSDLTGNWKLNRDASDDPRKKMEESQATSGSSGDDTQGGDGSGGGSSYGHGGGGHHGHHGRGGDGSGGPVSPPPAMDSLQIVHQDPKLVVTDSSGREHVYYTDGRKSEEERSFGGTTAISAAWKDGHVVVDVAPEHGRPYTETYAVTGDGKQLTITTTWKSRGNGKALEIRRVYDAVAETPKPAADGPPATG